MTQSVLSRILRNFAHLKSERPNIFGAQGHGFQLNPVLTESEVLAFELEHDIALPDDYRDFLIHVGNGGAGPYYGVFPLGHVDGPFELERWAAGNPLVGILSKPFPFLEAWNDLTGMPPFELRKSNEDTYSRQMDAFEKRYWSETYVNGAIPICHQGCALRTYLVVTGPQAGHLWDDRRTEYAGLRPVRLKDGSAATFTAWYEEWLSDSLASQHL